MILDLFGQIFQSAQALLIPIPLDNPLSVLYVIFDLISKLLLAGNTTSGGGSTLPF